MRILHLYRPQVPSLRAQAIQIVHACHALASLGHEVTLLADPGDGPDLLAPYGLEPVPGLHIRVAPTAWKPGAGWWFRAAALAWWSGPPGVVLARDKRRLRWLLDATGGSRRHRIVLETHELDSALALEAGRDPTPLLELERRLLPRVHAMVANCGGTLEMWEETHGALLPEARIAAHNAVSPQRRRGPVAQPRAVIRCVGSLRAYKGVDALARAAADLPLPLEMIGGSPDELQALSDLPRTVKVLPPAPYTEVPDLLADSAALLLPLADNLFGRRLTSPLKLWDYLATSVPIVAPDLPTIREIALQTGVVLHWYRPGDPGSVLGAVQSAVTAGSRRPCVRTWEQRARELEPLLDGSAG